MIDLHCHLLPGIDDGPATLQESEVLAKAFVAGGITHAVVTPHIHPGRYENDVHTITAAFDSFSALLRERHIPLKIAMAAEVRICPEILTMIPAGLIPFIGEMDGNKVILLEFPHSHLLPGTGNMVKWLLDRDIVPLIAHPERNKEIMQRPEKLRPYIEMGCLVQVTAGSVAGRFGEQVQAAARLMLERGWVSVLATDAHNLKGRPPELREGMRAAAEIVGAGEAIKLVQSAALAICGSRFASDTAA